MEKRNYFISYHHSSNYTQLKELRDKFGNKTFGDYGFKDENLGEFSKQFISKKIQWRLWSSSVTIVLIGEKTAESAWIDWEIWYSLQSYQDPNVSRRRYKPKGLLALYLPCNNPSVPERLQQNIDSGYAVEIFWDEIDTHFNEKSTQAYKNRNNIHLIQNSIPLREEPKTQFGNLSLKKLFNL